MRIRPLVLFCLLALLPLRGARADALDGFFPLGAQRGTTVTLTFPSMASVETATLFVDGDGITPAGPFKKGVGEVRVAADARPGIRQLRLVGPKSASPPRPFEVGVLPVLVRKATTERNPPPFRIEQLPVTVQGALPRYFTVHEFQLTLKKDECLVAETECRRLAAPTILEIHLRTPAGTEIPDHLDTRKLDPTYSWQIPSDGDYRLQLTELTGAHNDDNDYWINLTTGPWLEYASPAGARRGQRAHLTLFGYNLAGKAGPGSMPLEVQVPASAGPALTITGGQAPNSLSLVVGERPETAEAEPNDSPAQAQSLALPATVNGAFQAKGDRDYYRFAAHKGDALLLSVQARDLGSFADTVLLLQDDTGKTLETVDDQQNSRDPRLVWTAPADGNYVVLLHDIALAARGGPEFFYRFTIAPAVPELRVDFKDHLLLLKPGAHGEVTVTLSHSLELPALKLQVEGLPPGVTADPVTVPASPNREGSSEIRIPLAAAAGAALGAAGIRVSALAAKTGKVLAVATWRVTGDGNWDLGSGATSRFLVLIPAP